MNTPRFSVIIPTLNEEKFLPILLTSLADQTKKNFEVIVADGKSKDATTTVAQKFVGKLPLTVVVCERARLPLQRNRGAARAGGEWLVFVDADSVMLPYTMERLETIVASENVSFFTAWGKPDSQREFDSVWTLLYNIALEAARILHRPLSPGPFTVVSRKAFDGVGGYDESLTFGEDQNLTQRLVDAGTPLRIIRETLYVWSMRRFRAQGMLKPVQTYIRASLLLLFAKRNFRTMPGYLMGGHLYDKKKSVKRPVIKEFEKKLKKMMREVFG